MRRSPQARKEGDKLIFETTERKLHVKDNSLDVYKLLGSQS